MNTIQRLQILVVLICFCISTPLFAEGLQDFHSRFCKAQTKVLGGTCTNVASFQSGDYTIATYRRTTRAPNGSEVDGETTVLIERTSGKWQERKMIAVKAFINGKLFDFKFDEAEFVAFARDRFRGDPAALRNVVTRLAWKVDDFCTKYVETCKLVPSS